MVCKICLTKKSKIVPDGTKLFQIRAKTDINNKYGLVKKGTLGGWISSLKLENGEDRVSGDAWVYGNAWVSGDAMVYGDVRVSGDAMVSGRFDLTTNCDIELPRIKIGTKSKLMKLKKFLDKF